MNPDLRVALSTPIDHSGAIGGDASYRVWGSRRTVAYLGFGTCFGGYGSSGPIGPSGYIEAKHGAAARRRRCHRPWARRGGGLRRGDGRALRRLAAAFARRKYELPRFDPAVAAAADGKLNIHDYHGYWELAPREALVVTVTPPACDYWNFQPGNHWMESLDSRYQRTDVNPRGACAEADGSARLIVAAEDPASATGWIPQGTSVERCACVGYALPRARSRPRVVTLRELRSD